MKIITSLIFLATLTGCSINSRPTPNGLAISGHLGTNRAGVVEAEGDAATLMAARYVGQGIPDDWNATPDVTDDAVPRITSSGYSYFYAADAENRTNAVGSITAGIVSGIGLGAWKDVQKAGEVTTQVLGRQATRRAVAETATKVPLAAIEAQ